jgi:hypothetical protein
VLITALGSWEKPIPVATPVGLLVAYNDSVDRQQHDEEHNNNNNNNNNNNKYDMLGADWREVHCREA